MEAAASEHRFLNRQIPLYSRSHYLRPDNAQTAGLHTRHGQVGLCVPITRLQRTLMTHCSPQITMTQSQGILRYVTMVETVLDAILDAAATDVRNRGRTKITPDAIARGVRETKELNELFGNGIFPNSSVEPVIHKFLIKEPSK